MGLMVLLCGEWREVERKSAQLIVSVKLGNYLVARFCASRLRFINEGFKIAKRQRKTASFFGEVEGQLIRKVSHSPSMALQQEGV